MSDFPQIRWWHDWHPQADRMEAYAVQATGACSIAEGAHRLWDRKLSCVAAPTGPEAMCAGRRVHRAHAAIVGGVMCYSSQPPLLLSLLHHGTTGAPGHKSLCASIISFIPRAKAAWAAAFRRRKLGSNERFWQQSPKWNVSKPHACPLGLSVNKPLSIRGRRRGPRPGAETAY